MSYEDLLRAIYRETPELEGQLSSPRVIYVRAQQKTYIIFESSVLVGESQFLKIERVLRGVFPQRDLSLRVKCPSLRESFLDDISEYRPVLTDFLKRNYPSSRGWLDQIDWRMDTDCITLTFPNEFSMHYMGNANVAGRLRQAVKDIFDADIKVELTVNGDREARLEQIRREKNEMFVVTREEMNQRYGTGLGENAPKPRKPRAPKAESEGNDKPEKLEKPARAVADNAMPVPEMTDNTLGKPIVGRAIADYPIEMKELNGESGLVVIQGDIFMLETKELKGGETLLVSFAVTDYTSSVMCKIFLRYRNTFGRKGADPEEAPPPITDEERKRVQEKVDRIKNGMNVKIRGNCVYDNFVRELCVTVRDMVEMEKPVREDNAEEKRVELHMHTNMSSMDALTPAEDLVARAIKWGHPAVAITDHGVLQSFPAAFKAAKKQPIKLIPGCEGYLIDEKPIVDGADDHPLDGTIVTLRVRATGSGVATARIISVDAARIVGETVSDLFSETLNPGESLKPKVVEETGLTDVMLRDKERAETVLPRLMDFIGDSPVASFGSELGIAILKAELRRLDRAWDAPAVDMVTYMRKLHPEQKSFKPAAICKAMGVKVEKDPATGKPGPADDAAHAAKCLVRMIAETKERFPSATTLRDLNDTVKGGAIGDSWHIILLAKTQQGMVNLNRLVSIGHLEYFSRRPHMPRFEISKYREGLIIGSACEAGELFRAMVAGASWDKLKEIASFYDYLEIQPIGNNAFMLRNGQAADEEELREYNRKIVRLGDEMGLPVVATGDVHFMDPHDAIGRAIIQAGMGFEDADHQPPLYFRTTDEMLEEFSYLGEEKAKEVVITNPRMIADQVENLRLFPKHPKDEDTFQPVWPDAEMNIQNMTWSTAREMYGDPLPDIVQLRLEKELKSIVGYGYCTLYNIAERLVSKSLENGYLVGSRGSVGSSLVARMCGITEVNALPPHYRCPHCRKGYFDVDKTRYHVGVDLPDRDCPGCGRLLVKDGFDIPFEVFLGFEGDKVPDIDLNFSGEYQNKAHHYVEELFGHDHVFRAGTISGLADKTAYGYAKKYLEERGLKAGNAEITRLAGECTGVKKTTGQHPGGMVVVPKEYEIYQFTAVQHPADDLESDFTTTHFDFNSMHDILVKLDCLGHDDPTMMHVLEELTGINFRDVPLDDWGVRSLFTSPDALGVTEEEILCDTGTYGVPEFGTAFVRGMLQDTKPSTMEELLRISGLSHGTDVWLGNAKDIIASGIATLSDCVCCRDDIMNYLMDKGVAPKLSFTTMESVRKGKGLKPEMEQAMLDANVPDWFMDSCKKIKYMFPKGHAVAYVTMSLRVAWYKLRHPAAYYCAYFTVRGDGFDASTMLVDPDVCREKIREIRAMENAGPKEKEQATALELTLEMNMRGIKFLPVDLYRSEVKRFVIEDGNLRCPFTSLGGLGESAAIPIVEARKNGPFLSIEDLRNRAKVGSSVLDLLRAQGALEGLSETSQISMF